MKLSSSRLFPRTCWSAAHVLAVLALGGCSSKSSTADKPTSKDSGVAAAKTDWVTMGYDVQSTYHNTAETKLSKDNVATLQPAWTNPPKLQVYGTPVVVGDTVYVGDNGDGIHALNAADGSEIWSFPLPQPDGSAAAGVTSSLGYEDGVLYFLASTGGRALALDVSGAKPKLKWDKPYEASAALILGFSSAIVVGDLVVFGDSSLDTAPDPNPAVVPFRGSVVALHKADGSLAWQTPTATAPEDGCSVWGSVAIDPIAKVVYAPVGNNFSVAGPGSDSIVAFNLGDGSVKWTKQVDTKDVFNLSSFGPGPDSDFGANPVVFDVGDKKLVAAGQKSGKLYVWDRLAGGDPLVSTSLGNGSSFIGGVFQGLAFDGTHLIAVCNSTKNTSGNPKDEPSNGDSGSTSVLYALDPLTLDTIYSRQLAASVWNPITIANGVGYLGEEKTLEAFDLATGDSLFTYKVPGTVGSGITISNGRLFFGSGLTYALFGHADGSFHSLALP